jgi:hypothetical protein
MDGKKSVRFLTYCGKCFNSVQHERGGLVLSCGDFICANCSLELHSMSGPTTCPACDKKNVKSLLLESADLPKDVINNMTDLSIHLENLRSITLFQMKHYSRLIDRMRDKLQRTSSFM